MDISRHIERLASDAEVIRRLTGGITDAQARWKPAADRWSILEVINHLADEEREDFRTRLDLILHHPDSPWPPIDPFNWVAQRGYNERPPDASLHAFLAERDHSLKWLQALSHPSWQAAHAHPEAGVLRAGDLMVSWVAHDFFHIRQMTNLLWEHLAVSAQPYSTAYAGPYA